MLLEFIGFDFIYVPVSWNVILASSISSIKFLHRFEFNQVLVALIQDHNKTLLMLLEEGADIQFKISVRGVILAFPSMYWFLYDANVLLELPCFTGCFSYHLDWIRTKFSLEFALSGVN